MIHHQTSYVAEGGTGSLQACWTHNITTFLTVAQLPKVLHCHGVISCVMYGVISCVMYGVMYVWRYKLPSGWLLLDVECLRCAAMVILGLDRKAIENVYMNSCILIR